MESPITMFREKDADGEHWSMTRVAIGAFTVAYIVRIFRFSLMGVAFGWPDAFVIFSIVFALPFAKLFSGGAGATLFGKFLDKFGIGAAGVNAAVETLKVVAERKIEPQPPAPQPEPEPFKPHEWADDKEDGIL